MLKITAIYRQGDNFNAFSWYKQARSGLGIIYLNVRSLLPKIDFVRVWAQTTNADIIVISESWLNKSINDNVIFISGCNISRVDHVKRSGGNCVIVYSKCRFHTQVLIKKSIPNQLEILDLQVELSKDYHITKLKKRAKETLSTLSNILSKLPDNELALCGDLNWQSPVSDEFKTYCNSMNFTQLIDSPTRPNLKCPEKSVSS